MATKIKASFSYKSLSFLSDGTGLVVYNTMCQDFTVVESYHGSSHFNLCCDFHDIPVEIRHSRYLAIYQEFVLAST